MDTGRNEDLLPSSIIEQLGYSSIPMLLFNTLVTSIPGLLFDTLVTLQHLGYSATPWLLCNTLVTF